MANGLEQQKVDYKVKCVDCGKDARMTLLMRNEDGACVFVECKYCENAYAVSLELIKRFEMIGAAICDAKMCVGCLLNI